MKAVTIGTTILRLVQGDITTQQVDVIVNAANESLYGGGGVDGAIHRAGGPDILAECKRIRQTRYPDGLPVGQAVMTTGGRLPAAHVIHTVGPQWQGSSEDAKLLADCYRNSLQLAVDEHMRTIAFPSISTGVYGYPVAQAARVALKAIADFLQNQNGKLNEVRMVLFSPHDLHTYETALAENQERGS